MTTTAVATIIVTYNSAGTIADCLEAVLASSEPTALFVIDNASSDATLDVVARVAPHAIVHAGTENLGFAAACNIGIGASASLEPRYLFFVNPDAIVAPSCLGHLVREMDERLSAAIASPLITEADAGTIWYAGAQLDVQHGIFWHIGWGESDLQRYTQTTVTGRPTGCVMLVRTACADAVGPMDPSYFLYWEEVEWTLRFKEQGRDVLFVPSATAKHHVSSSTGGVSSKIYEYYYLRNRLRLVRDVTGMSRRTLIVASLRPSADKVYATIKLHGLRAGMSAGRALLLAYVDFLRGATGQRASL